MMNRIYKYFCSLAIRMLCRIGDGHDHSAVGRHDHGVGC